MKEIELTQGKVALVDDEDYEWLNQWNWCAVRLPNKNNGSIHWYASRGWTRYMHRFILNLIGTKQRADHIDGDGLNNQRFNLRIATGAQNNMNRRNVREHSSQYKGVSWDYVNQKWMVRIKAKGYYMNLGRFVDEVEAALAYDRAAMHYFGEYANLNFIHKVQAQ